MSKLSLAALVALVPLVYVFIGSVTYPKTVARLQHACLPVPELSTHVLTWPLSWGLSTGLRSHC